MPKNWIGKATDKMEKKGTVGSLRAVHGVKGDKTIPVKTLDADIAKGGKLARKAQFAKNVRK
jgi:hypothetical protein